MTKLTDKQRYDAMKLVAAGMTKTAVAKQFGVTQQYISKLAAQMGVRPGMAAIRAVTVKKVWTKPAKPPAKR